ncbi:U3 small nucleolar RNA-associated protein 6 [Smittium mucronatum]|uniref:U3 small nucleolar RNA-associated protein 6 n=1 Tax=Smittium mucronatum TaxID=133383 RepID=A0A1R0H7J8_9FUNG|nr:U3 small nucleolar RNA-associated protein 6 [Smittium mucronatum]
MAEIIQYKLEGMIPELEDFEQKGVFTKEEIRLIVKKRTSFEYLIKARAPGLDDFIRYIEYESNLDLLRIKRRQRLGVTGKPTISDRAIKMRIINIFERAIQKHRGNIDLWLRYISYTKHEEKLELSLERFQQQEQLGKYTRVMKLYSRAIQNFPNSDIFWIESAKFEFEVNGNDKNARKLMQRGLRLNKKSKKIWYEYIKMELIFAERIKMRRKILQIDSEKDKTEESSKGDVDEDIILVPLLEGEEAQESLDKRNETKLLFEEEEFDKALNGEDIRKIKKKSKLNNTSDNADGNSSVMHTDNNPYLKGEVAILIYKYAIKDIHNDLSFRKSIIDLFNEFEISDGVTTALNDIKADFDITNPDALFYGITAWLELKYKLESKEWLELFATIVSEVDEILSKNSNLSLSVDESEQSSGVSDFEKKVLDSEAHSNIVAFSELYHQWLVNIYKKLDRQELKNYIKALICKTYSDISKYGILSPKLTVSQILFLKLNTNDSHMIKSVADGGFKYNYRLSPEQNSQVVYIYLVYLRILLSNFNAKKSTLKKKKLIASEFESVFNSSISWCKKNSCNNLVIYNEWLKASDSFASSDLLSIDELHSRYETVMKNLSTFYNQPLIKVDPGFEIDLGYGPPANRYNMRSEAISNLSTASHGTLDYHSLLQIKYINFTNPKKGLSDASTKINLMAVRNSFDKICLFTKPTIDTLNYVLALETIDFDTNLLKIVGNGLVNIDVIEKSPVLKSSVAQIKKVYELATSMYKDKKEIWSNYIVFLRKIGDFDSANNALFSASKIHQISV